jgi:chromosome transmission fidelity protein 1
LSLICGALHWLEDHREREAAAAAGATAAAAPVAGGDAGEPDWVRDFASQQGEARRRAHEVWRAERLAKARERLARAQPPAAAAPAAGAGDPDAEFLVDEWHSDAEGGGGVGGPGAGAKRGAARAAAAASDSDAGSGADALGDGEPEPPRRAQVIFCSRTHSQLAQFVGELRRTRFAETVALVALGSRRQLCVNDDVLRLGAPALVSERCLELQKPPAARKAAAAGGGGGAAAGKPRRGAAPASRCAYRAAGASRAADATRDMILAAPLDVEELARLGRRRATCPYYAARAALPEADVVLAPYPALLAEETRAALGVRLEGAVVIVDEAHNLTDAVNGAHAAELGAGAAGAARVQLAAYFERFGAVLAPGNARNVQALIRAAGALERAAAGGLGAGAANGGAAPANAPRAVTVNDFLFATGLDNVNLLRLARYARESKAVFKVAGYWQARRAAAAQGGAVGAPPAAPPGAGAEGGATGALFSLLAFLQALTNDDADGRVVADPAGRTLRFVLLNAAAYFGKVVSAARAVVLASGTLSPLAPVLQLFPGVPPAAVHRYSCGHVVEAGRLCALALGAGPSGAPLDFRHAARGSPAALDELGRLLANACAAAPGGVVAFFPSFAYADAAAARWAATGALAALERRKRVLREPRAAADVEATLAEYAAAVAAGAAAPRGGRSGALLLAVVGAKLAEGINFGDALGRLVVMVGLPYPNPADPELRERLRYVDRFAGGAGAADGGGAASREHYQDLCMKAVNQCVGRAIRHARDYAAVLLADARYAAPAGPAAKLPGWMRGSLVACRGYGEAQARLVRFYRDMAEAEAAEAAATGA